MFVDVFAQRVCTSIVIDELGEKKENASGKDIIVSDDKLQVQRMSVDVNRLSAVALQFSRRFILNSDVFTTA